MACLPVALHPDPERDFNANPTRDANPNPHPNFNTNHYPAAAKLLLPLTLPQLSQLLYSCLNCYCQTRRLLLTLTLTSLQASQKAAEERKKENTRQK